MAALPYMQLYVADYLADTAHLSTVEHGAYLLLMFNYWQRGESFKAKDEQTLNKRLATVARLSIEEWMDVRETLAEFFDVTETEWAQHRIDRDIEAVNAKSNKARAAGIASGERRSNRRSTNAERTLNHTDTDTDTDKKEKDKKETGASAEAPAPLPAKNSKITFRKWLEALKAKGEQPIPADDPVFAYATDADLPNEFLGLAWREFRARYLSEEKRYIDWRIVFRKAVRSNWLGLWYCEGTQGYLLTSKGLQAQKAAQAAAKEAA